MGEAKRRRLAAEAAARMAAAGRETRLVETRHLRGDTAYEKAWWYAWEHYGPEVAAAVTGFMEVEARWRALNARSPEPEISPAMSDDEIHAVLDALPDAAEREALFRLMEEKARAVPPSAMMIYRGAPRILVPL